MDEEQRPKNVRSHFEAGISLLYGEIGDLLARLEALQAKWPEQVAQADAQLASSAERVAKASQSIENATNRHKAVIKKYTQIKLTEGVKTLHSTSQEELDRLQELVTRGMADYASKALVNEMSALQSATFVLETAACRLRFPWKLIGALLIFAALIGGGIGGWVAYLLLKG